MGYNSGVLFKWLEKVDSDKMKNVGERLVAARESVGLDRAKAAEKLGVGYQTLRDLEAGKKTPSLDKVHEIATAWGVDPASLDSRLASTSPMALTPQLDFERVAKAAAFAAGEAVENVLAAWLAGRRLPGEEPQQEPRKDGGQ